GIERDPIPYITLVDDNRDGSNILQWKIVLELSPVHDSLDSPAVIGRASGSPYCKPPGEKTTDDGILAGVADPGSADPVSRPAARAYFAFKFEFPANYPFKPPIVTVLSNSYHPNIVTSIGEICDYMLKGEGWSPTLNVKNVCAQLRKFLCDPDPNDPLTSKIAPILTHKETIEILHTDVESLKQDLRAKLQWCAQDSAIADGRNGWDRGEMSVSSRRSASRLERCIIRVRRSAASLERCIKRLRRRRIDFP
ncbi:hypothetical protein ACHAW6_005789, partial [Cyclotella cf. meneghiniana]